jgi:prophage regulatory protein
MKSRRAKLHNSTPPFSSTTASAYRHDDDAKDVFAEASPRFNAAVGKKNSTERRPEHCGDADGDDGRYRRPINLLDYDDLRTRGIRMSRVQLWRLIRAGKFPRQIKVGTKNAWVEREIDAWIESRIAARDVA